MIVFGKSVSEALAFLLVVVADLCNSPFRAARGRLRQLLVQLSENAVYV